MRYSLLTLGGQTVTDEIVLLTDRIQHLEREARVFRIELRVLIQMLSETDQTPILGPGRWEKYGDTLKKALAKAGL
jgi:hypothetical protein